MICIKSHDLWQELKMLAYESNGKKAAVAYVSDDSVISFSEGDLLITDASDYSIASGRTAAKVLQRAFVKGAELYSCDSLHGKTIVFDSHTYIGSANISNNSVNNLDELGIISDHPNVMSGAIQLIDCLQSRSLKIDNAFIDRVLRINVEQGTKSKIRKKNILIDIPTTWLVSLRNDALFPGNETLVEKENKKIEVIDKEERSWFWIRKGIRFYESAKIGDSVIIIERKTKELKEPESVYRHVVLKNISIDSDTSVKAYHYAYTDEYKISWTQFNQLALQANIKTLGSGLNTVRELTDRQSNILFELWLS